jgi:hypothetical protein
LPRSERKRIEKIIEDTYFWIHGHKSSEVDEARQKLQDMSHQCRWGSFTSCIYHFIFLHISIDRVSISSPSQSFFLKKTKNKTRADLS